MRGGVSRARNGGFPAPPAGEPVRLVRARHDACGGSTRVRLPGAVPARAVRRVVCDRCREPFEAADVQEVAGSVLHSRAWLHPHSRSFRLGGLVIAAAAVLGVLAVVNGTGGQVNPSPAPVVAAAPTPAPPSTRTTHAAAKVVHADNFTLALPAGWSRSKAPDGAAFAAESSDGQADATLWIQREPSLSLSAFETKSLAQLRSLAGNAHEVSRVAGPTADASVITLAADTPADEPSYQVTLRAAGPYRYYLATTVKPAAPGTTLEAANLIRNSLVPTAATAGAGR
jgi:hypothetical protein